MRAKIALNTPTNIKVCSGLLSESLVSEYEQAERSEHTAIGSATARAAVVGDVGLNRSVYRIFFNLKLNFYVQLK